MLLLIEYLSQFMKADRSLLNQKKIFLLKNACLCKQSIASTIYLNSETELEALEQNPAFRLITQIELLEKRNHLRLSYKKAN